MSLAPVSGWEVKTALKPTNRPAGGTLVTATWREWSPWLKLI